jgi:hypothetical protein
MLAALVELRDRLAGSASVISSRSWAARSIDSPRDRRSRSAAASGHRRARRCAWALVGALLEEDAVSRRSERATDGHRFSGRRGMADSTIEMGVGFHDDVAPDLLTCGATGRSSSSGKTGRLMRSSSLNCRRPARYSTAPSRSGRRRSGYARRCSCVGGSVGRRRLVLRVRLSGTVDPNSPQFRAVVRACCRFIPAGGSPALSPVEQAGPADAARAGARMTRG